MDIDRQFTILPADVRGIFRVLDSDGTAHLLSNVEGISYRREPGPGAKSSHVDGVTKNVREIHLEEWTVGKADATVVLADESYGYGPTVIAATRIVSITQVG
jgi:hypothetical protein